MGHDAFSFIKMLVSNILRPIITKSVILLLPKKFVFSPDSTEINKILYQTEQKSFSTDSRNVNSYYEHFHKTLRKYAFPSDICMNGHFY